MTPHFSLATDPKLACSCGCGLLPDQEFMWLVERLRVRFGKPMKVTSGARCPSYNATVSATGLQGPHTTQKAIDIGVSGADALRLVRMALEGGFTGVGMKQHGPYPGRFVHLDVLHDAPGQPRPHCWTYP